MARGLGVVTIVEGVESEAGWRLFHDINANYFQGQKYSESIRPSNFGELASDIRIDNASIPAAT
jgi:EAL domain-containing protein (putative c-di-GMP-specific phosphodiesterase class I)